ncbi:MobF family relaxase [Thermodesulfobacterium sp.]|jgi:conjugative relaxase-like TrwC/TraI family protein|uniref:MobF family relaxase n=1 Tax=Thermodesulfobacterium sp. TaxID=1965289 RepID=UPI00257B34DA|nr:MobF family relaxase [Thermodesulfobacterium sp.]MBZ4682332.1 conjugative relaxase domain protein [Thermodesulfobacterium sp.]
MLGISQVSSADYYTRLEHTVEYYSEQSTILGHIEKTGLGKNFEEREITAERLKELGKEFASSKRFGFDLTFSAPKEVSALFALTGEQKILEAHQKAVSAALERVNQDLYTRNRSEEAKALGQVFERADGLFIRFDHLLNRNLEPQLHSHVLVFNKVERLSDGQLRAVEMQKVYENQKFYDTVYKLELAKNLRELYNTNLEVKLNEENQKYLDVNFNNEKLSEFAKELSTRRDEVLEKAQALSSQGSALNRAELESLAAKMTRDSKQAVDIDKHFDSFKREFEEKFGSVENVLSELKERESEKEVDKETLKEILKETMQALTERESVVRKEEVIKTAVEIAALRGLRDRDITIQDLEKAYKELEMQGEIKTYTLSEGGMKKEFTTSKEQLALEKSNLEIVNSMKDKAQALYSKEEVSKLISEFEKEKGFTLSDGQKQAVEKTLTSRDYAIVWQGVAGAGKTTSMELVSKALQEKGYNVIGLAPTGKAAEELAKTIGSADTIHSFLNQIENGRIELSEKTALIIDESSMLSSKLSEKVLSIINESGARAIFVGDTSQLQAVESGKFFSDIQQHTSLEKARISEIQRQKTLEYRELTQALADREIDKAKAILENKITEVKSKEDLIKSAVQDYLKAVQEGRNALVVTTTNNAKDILNAEIRESLKENGYLSNNEKTVSVFIPKDLSSIEKRFAQFYQQGDYLRFNSMKDLKQALSKEVRTEIAKQVLSDTAKAVAEHVFTEIKTMIKYPRALELSNLKNFERALKNLSHFERKLERALDTNKFYKDLGLEFKITGIDRENNKLQLESVKNAMKVELDLNKHYDKFNVFQEKEIKLAVGDKVMTLQNDRSLGLKNGQIYTIKEVTANSVILKSQSGKLLKEIDLSHYKYLDHGYASTIHKAQGATVDKVIHIHDSRLDYNTAYTALTRGKYEYSVYTLNKESYLKSLEKDQLKTSSVEFEKLAKEEMKIESEFKKETEKDVKAKFESSKSRAEEKEDRAGKEVSRETESKTEIKSERESSKEETRESSKESSSSREETRASSSERSQENSRSQEQSQDYSRGR